MLNATGGFPCCILQAFCSFTALVKSPTKRNETYFPFGRPGGGAPIRDDRGKVRANVTGIVENEQVVSSLIFLSISHSLRQIFCLEVCLLLVFPSCFSVTEISQHTSLVRYSAKFKILDDQKVDLR